MSKPFTYRISKPTIRVIDGDTIEADIEMGLNVVLANQKIRLNSINTPEARTRDLEEKARGLAAKARLQEMIDGAEVVAVTSADRGKFGRILGTIYGDGVDLNQQLVDEGHAVPYFGGKR